MNSDWATKAASEIWAHVYKMCVTVTPPERLEIPTLEDHWLAVEKIREVITRHQAGDEGCRRWRMLAIKRAELLQAMKTKMEKRTKKLAAQRHAAAKRKRKRHVKAKRRNATG